MTGSVAAILLAAGKSRRMGRCKQLLPLGETTVIGRCLKTLIAAGISDIVAVVSNEGREVAEAAHKYPVSIVVNSLPDGDMASSVRVGRNALSPGVSGVIIALCDYPLLSPSTVTQLVRQHNESPGFIIIPTHADRRGHPVLFPRSVLDDLTADLSLRDLVQCEPARNYHLAVTDEGALLDMDTPEDYDTIRRMANA